MLNTRHNKIREAAFDSFDDETFNSNGYDPDYADAPGGSTVAVKTARKGQKMQINLTLNNPTASKITFDIFNALTATKVLKPELVVGTYSRIPGLSFEGQAAYPNNIDIFDQNGALMIRGAALAPVASISCGEYPYLSLLETTKTLPFHIVVMRISAATQAQLNNNIDYKMRTYAGYKSDNTINVRSYKKLINPAQLDIDVKAGVTITGESGLYYPLEAGEVVQLGLYINRWSKPTL